jgi:hypothetical protein
MAERWVEAGNAHLKPQSQIMDSDEQLKKRSSSDKFKAPNSKLPSAMP